MEQAEFNNIQDIKFSTYFSDIENLRPEDLDGVNTLIKKYPYCQALHLLAARSAVNTHLYEKTIANAAISVPSRNILYNFIHHPAKFKENKVKKANVVKEAQEVDTLISIIDQKEPTSKILNNDIDDHVSENEVFEEITPSVAPEETLISIHQQPVLEINEIENLSLDGEKYSETLIVAEIADDLPNQDSFSDGDEIAEGNKEEVIAEEEESSPVNEEENFETVAEEKSIDTEELAEEKVEDEFVKAAETVLPYIENIQEEEIEEDEIEQQAAESPKQENLPQVKDPVNLSKYDDERLPYTFLWWLAKTRKTYGENLRPYATFSLDTTQEIKKNESDPLEHQIAENIFHINSLSDIENKTGATSTVAFDFMKKEHQIIERFIKEEPQIKPPVANKIDTENKAKKSSEDSNELVSETLAKVYVEQMLFHKALDVYKKLSLKYPEKSAYFASQIKYLELKVN